MQYDVVILTDQRYVEIRSGERPDWYKLQVLLEDELVRFALEKKGLNVERKAWCDSSFDWSSTCSVLFRTTWDYFDRFQEFQPWLESVQQMTQLFNPAQTILWNMDKHYLADLMDRGVPCVETHFISQGQQASLHAVMTERNWNEAILKPVVSGAARHTYRVYVENLEEMQAQFDRLVQKEDFMLQPFQERILDEGEISLMVMNGHVTHGVRKVARPGDFRVQDDHGGLVYPHLPTDEEIQFAEMAIRACDPVPVYGRVDMIRSNAGGLAIMELELIEPELFFRFHRPAADTLAEGLVSRLKKLNNGM